MREAKFLKCVMKLFGLEVAVLPVTLTYNHQGHKSDLNVLLLGGWGNYFCFWIQYLLPGPCWILFSRINRHTIGHME